MRKKVLSTEVSQFREAIRMRYNTVNPPKITLIFVNKKISQRFFMENSQGQFVNPPSGSLIDESVVESEGD
jgi:hypothetical protein